MGLIKDYGLKIGEFIWKHLKEGTGFGELHSSQVAKRIRDLAAKAKKLEDDAIYAAKDKGPRDVLLKFKDTKKKPTPTEHVLDPKTGKRVVKTETMVEKNKRLADKRKAQTVKSKQQGEQRTRDRKTARSPAKSRGMLQFGKSEKEKASQRLTSPSKRGIKKQTDIKKRRLQRSIYEVRDIDKRYPKATVYDFNPKTGKLELTRGKVKPPKGHKGDPKDPQKPLMSKTRFAKRADRPGYGSRTKGQERPETVPQPVKGTPKKMQPKHEYVIDKKTGKKVLKYTKGTKPSQNPKWMTGKSRTTTTKAERAAAKAKAKAAKAKKDKEKKRAGFN